MGRATGFSNCFNAGEIDPDADARSDLQQYAHGLSLARNLIGQVAGPQRRRTGFWLIGVAGAKTRWIPFVRSVEDAVAIELGVGRGWIWNADGTRVMDGASQATFVHDLTLDDIFGLMWEQNGDVMWFTLASGGRIRRLKRLSQTQWVFGDLALRSGPFRGENGDASFTLQIPSGPTVGGTLGAPLVASKPLFQPGHVGALFRLRLPSGVANAKSWAPGTAFSAGEPAVSNGRTYKTNVGGTSGNTPPVHELGTASDGAMEWDYHDDGAGVVAITGVTDAQNATCDVIYTLPFYLGNGPTSWWSEGAFSDYRGYPTAKPAIREERLVFGGAPQEPDKFDATRTAGFDADSADFKPGLGSGMVTDDDAVRRFAGDTPGRLRWLVSGSYLIAGLSSAEVIVTGATLDDPIAPGSTVARGLTDYGSARIQPVKAHGAILYVQRSQKTLRELVVSPDQALKSRDLSVLAGHIAGRRIAEVVWAGTSNVAWVRLEDGGLASLTYHEEHGVYGWNSHEIGPPGAGFTVDSLMVLPGPGEEDRLWLHVSRQKDGATQRLLLMQAPRADGLFYDAAEYYAGPAVAAVGGLEHLEGETVSAMADGAEYPGLVVQGGAVALPAGETASEIWVGLPYRSRAESLPLDLMGPGSGQGRRQRVKGAIVVFDGVRARVGQDNGRLETVTPRRATDVVPVVRRVEAQVVFDGDTDRDVRVVVETDAGWDLALKALRPSSEVND